MIAFGGAAAAAVIALHRQNVRGSFGGTEKARGPGGSSSAGLLLERRHRQAGVLEPCPVELGLLAVAGPDNCLAGVVDRVGQPSPCS